MPNLEPEYSLGVLIANRQTTQILRNADMFERFKCVVEMDPHYFGLRLTDKDFTVEQAIAKVTTKLQTHPECWPVVVWCEEKKLIWTDPEIKVISNGQKFGLLRDWIRSAELHEYTPITIPDSKPNGTGDIKPLPKPDNN